MSLKAHIPPTLHNAIGTIIATIIIAATGGSYLWLRDVDAIKIPVWALLAVCVCISGTFGWLLFRLRSATHRFVLHSATWGAGNRLLVVTEVLRSKISDGHVEVQASNDVFGDDPYMGVESTFALIIPTVENDYRAPFRNKGS
jgi:hypothetical protein